VSILQSFSLDGKVALVTGASRGIGEAMALAFAEAGAQVALVARTEGELERVREAAQAHGRRALAIPGDLADIGTCSDVVQRTVSAFGRIDVLANVAGTIRRVPILDATPADYDAVLQLNLRSVYFLYREVGRVMVEQRQGKIINIASMTSYRGYADLSPYSLSKTAIVSLTKNLAVEWAPYNIQANAIAPGWIETALTASMAPSRRQWVIDHTPQGRFGSPRDVALLALYLASPASDFMTGAVLPLDGGFLAGHAWPPL